MSLDGKVALVTGASRGIGYAIAETLAHSGAVVLGTATTEAGAERISTYLAELGNAGKGYCLDVTDAEQVNSVIKEAGAEFGAPLILVNNAGITRDNLIMRMKEDEWDSVVDTNLNALYRVTRACLRGMTRARWGRIITVSSVVGAMGNAGQSNYAATKAGAEGFTRSLARELGGRGITANAVAPGFIDTDMTRELPEDHRAALVNQIALGRLGQPEEVAAVVAFLASEAAGYVTGATLHVNGGMYMG